MSRLGTYVLPATHTSGPHGGTDCLREVAATLEKALPYLFVHEADEKKGGAPFAALKLELQDEAQRTQLFDDRRVTQWHRKSEFQMISLIEIAEDMLKHSPK